jgi:hypothetical protein
VVAERKYWNRIWVVYIYMISEFLTFLKSGLSFEIE